MHADFRAFRQVGCEKNQHTINSNETLAFPPRLVFAEEYMPESKLI
jgi:hypothetical protein